MNILTFVVYLFLQFIIKLCVTEMVPQWFKFRRNTGNLEFNLKVVSSESLQSVGKIIMCIKYNKYNARIILARVKQCTLEFHIQTIKCL